MPEEFEGDSQQDTGLESGESGSHEAPSEGAQASAGDTAQQPNYMTREAFEEAMAGYSTSQQERIDKVLQNFGGMQDMIKSLVESQKPKPPPLIPDEKDLANIDARGMRDLLHRMAEEHKGSLESLRKEMADTKQEWKRQTEASRIHGFLSDQIGKTSEQYPLLKKPLGKQLLQSWVISSLQGNNNDYRKVNVAQMGQQINAFLEGELKERMSSAASRATNAPAAGQRGPDGKFLPAKSPPKGSGTKPAANDTAGLTLKNFSQRARQMIEGQFGGGGQD